ncbi:MAG: hypothetical protein K8S98_12475 [Planctomycetes bacterium]|nr:hypothetical protein [Planctomycetota bacterium]
MSAEFEHGAPYALASAARELLAVLLARVDGSERLLREVDAELDGDDLARFGRDLARASDEVEESGWLFGVLATGLGADTLIERVERGGLSAVLEWASAAARRLGRDLRRRDGEVPELALAPKEAQRLAFAFALLLVRAAERAELGACVAWSLDPSAEGWLVRVDGAVDAGTAAWLARFEATEVLSTVHAFAWRLPSHWLTTRSP